MKHGLKISSVGNRGEKVAPKLIVGKFNGYQSGEILDANATIDVVYEAISHDSTGDYATEQYVHDEISRVVGEAPEAYDTLKEIADKLQSEDDVVGSLTQQISTKANKSDIAEITQTLATKANSSDLSVVATSGNYNDLKNKPSVITSTTQGLKIEIVSEMPASPSDNTIYIVQ